jgi:hypothetical protein
MRGSQTTHNFGAQNTTFERHNQPTGRKQNHQTSERTSLPHCTPRACHCATNKHTFKHTFKSLVSSPPPTRPQATQPQHANAKSAISKMGELDDLIAKHANLSLKKGGEYGPKVYCSTTKRDIPATVAAVEAHLASKSYKRLHAEWYSDRLVEEYAPHIVPNRKSDKMLYCRLTQTFLNKIPAELEKHTNVSSFFLLFPYLHPAVPVSCCFGSSFVHQRVVISPSPLPLSSDFFVVDLRGSRLQVIPNGKLNLELSL